MLKKTEVKIKELLGDNKTFSRLEAKITDLLKSEKGLDLLMKLENEIMEQAYLVGYRDVIQERTKEEIEDNIKDHMSLDQVYELVDELDQKENASPQKELT